MIERIVYQLLKDAPKVVEIVGSQIYPRAAPQGTTGPRIIIQKDSSDRETHLTNEADCVSDLVSISCYHRTESEAEWLFQQVRNKISGMTQTLVRWIDVGGNLQSTQVYEGYITSDRSVPVGYTDGSDGDKNYNHRYDASCSFAHSQSVPTHK